MSNIHKNQRVGVFVDVQNMYYSAKNLYNSKVDFEKLLDAAVMNRKLIRASAYVIQADTPDEDNFFEALRKIGYEVEIKKLKEFYGGEKKGDWDLGMTVDMIQQAKKLDTIVLVTGDGDFAVLVDHLKSMGCRVEVMSFGRSSAKEIREAATNFVDMDENSDKFLVNH
ncbi:NYN domain-containing protein [Candidatus Nanohalovita haloferacivicina]|uniref:LabA-like NYN domain-containing protein n=1 Tax=Candidatus Nanohalovita haloferacivicina TaxID=2978046 RepID=UPI00325FA727